MPGVLRRRRSASSLPILAGFVAGVLWLTVSASGQQPDPAVPEPKSTATVRATVVDARGLQQWAPFTAVACAMCAGSGKTECETCVKGEPARAACPDCKGSSEHKAPCRACAGKGKTLDPLERAPCPTCAAAAFLPCTACDSAGEIEAPGDCPSCRGKGCYPCDTCKGQRFVETAAPKPSLRDAARPSLQAALETTRTSISQLVRFQPPGAASRREVKTLLKTLEDAQPVHPALKRARKTVEVYVAKICLAEDYPNNGPDEVVAMVLARDNALGYLRHQLRMLEVALARAEANERAAASKK